MTDIASLGIRVTTQGVSQATTDLGRLSKQAAATERASFSLGKAFASLGGGYLIGRAIGSIIRATVEAEQAQAQLAAVLKSTGGAAGLSARELNKMADSLQAVTTFDDEAITGAQSLLLTFTKIGKDVFPQATEAVLNMSQALGQDLKSSATQLGKALNDPIQGVTALRRVGVQFTDAQQDLIKSLVETGRAADAQKLILRELETEFGGSARAARDTLGGALQGLENDFKNLLEGDSGSDGIRGAKDAVNELGAAMRSPEVRAGFADLISGLAQVASFAAKATASLVGMARAARDALAADAQKSYLGLLAKRAALEDDLADLEAGGLRTLNLALKGRSGEVQLLSTKEANIARINGLLKEQTKLETQARAALAAADKGNDAPAGAGSVSVGGGPVAAKVTATRAAAGATRDLAAAEREEMEASRRAAEERDRAIETFYGMAAALNGPLAEAEFRHKQNLGDIEEAGRAAAVSSAEIADAKRKETERYEEQRREIQKQLDPVGELIAAKQEELRLMGLSEAAYRTAIDLRGLEAKATAEQRAAIEELNQAQIDAEKTTAAMDDFRESFTDAFASFLDGSKSAGEAFKDFADSVIKQIARIIAEQAALSLFGAPGTTQTGSMGGLVQSLFGGLFGGGRATGGPVAGGKLYEVNEGGAPELLTTGGRTFLLPGRAGHVTPMSRAGAGGGDIHVTVNVPAGTGRPVAQHIADAVGRKVAFSQRSGR